MSEVTIPFIRWGDYKSKDPHNPDILHLKVIDVESFETELSTNVKVQQKIEDNWEERILPLKSHDSSNKELLNQWLKAKSEKKIVPDAKFTDSTYMGVSKNNRAIRRHDLEF